MVDIGLATAAATANQLQSVLKLLPEEKGRPKFGPTGSPEKESKCPYLEVFMACHRKMDAQYASSSTGLFCASSCAMCNHKA